jgi:hypothetical protein
VRQVCHLPELYENARSEKYKNGVSFLLTVGACSDQFSTSHIKVTSDLADNRTYSTER